MLMMMFVCQLSFAQRKTISKTTPTKSAPTMKIKPPKLFTSLGVAKDSLVMPVEQARALIGASLKVTDDKNNPLTVTYYQFLYKRKAMTENEETGQFSPTTSIASDYFTTTPLPERWTKIIKEDLVAGEELYFFDVIAKDAQGHPFYAPNVKIITK
jgi:hypothetical protein